MERIGRLYSERYRDPSQLPNVIGISVEEALVALAREHPGLLSATGEIAVREGLAGSDELQAILDSVERQANPPA